MSNPFNSPALSEKRGFWACWTAPIRSQRGFWRALPMISGRPMPRKEHRFVGPFKTRDMAQGYCDEQNAAPARKAVSE